MTPPTPHKSAPPLNHRLLMIGCGNMGGAMVRRWVDVGVRPDQIAVIRPSGAPLGDAAPLADIAVYAHADAIDPAAFAPPTMIVLAMKPAQLAEVGQALRPHMMAGVPVLSLLAGIETRTLREVFPDQPIVRAMPNMPVAIGAGVVLRTLRGDDALDAAVDQVIAPLGLIHHVTDEAQFDLLTAVAGCGPAFFYRMVDAFAAAAIRLGVNEDDARTLVAATFQGAAATMHDSDQTPLALAQAVASKGGMTQAGLDVLDDGGRLVTLWTEVLRAARDRGKILASGA